MSRMSSSFPSSFPIPITISSYTHSPYLATFSISLSPQSADSQLLYFLPWFPISDICLWAPVCILNSHSQPTSLAQSVPVSLLSTTLPPSFLLISKFLQFLHFIIMALHTVVQTYMLAHKVAICLCSIAEISLYFSPPNFSLKYYYTLYHATPYIAKKSNWI